MRTLASFLALALLATAAVTATPTAAACDPLGDPGCVLDFLEGECIPNPIYTVTGRPPTQICMGP